MIEWLIEKIAGIFSVEIYGGYICRYGINVLCVCLKMRDECTEWMHDTFINEIYCGYIN